MLRILVILSMMLLTTIVVYPQKTESVIASYTYYTPENISLEEAKHIAENRAKIKAIEDAFGIIVTQKNTTILSNKNGESSNRFFSLGGSEVKGEWIETTKEPVYDIRYEHGTLVVIATLKGVIRELPQNRLTFSSAILRNGTTRKYESDDFKNGDDMYLQFFAPTDGYLIAYMYDETSDIVICLLPYIASNSQGNVKIKGGQNYVFFHKTPSDASADEYELTASNEKTEFETLYLIFSTNPIYTCTEEVNKDEVGKRYVPYKTFAKWLLDIRRSSEVKVEEKMISIKP